MVAAAECGGGGRQNAPPKAAVASVRRAAAPAASPFSAKESSIPFRSYSQTGWSFLNKFGSEGLKPLYYF